MASAPSLPIHDVTDYGRAHTVATGNRCSALGVGDATDLVNIRLGELGEAASSHVYCVRHHFHMGRVHTPSVAAEVIDLHTTRDGSVVPFPVRAMRTATMTVHGDHAVAVDVNHSLPLMASGFGGDRVVVLSPRVAVDESPALTSDDWILPGSPASRPNANVPSASTPTKAFAHGYSSPQWQVEYTVTKGCVS